MCIILLSHPNHTIQYRSRAVRDMMTGNIRRWNGSLYLGEIFQEYIRAEFVFSTRGKEETKLGQGQRVKAVCNQGGM